MAATTTIVRYTGSSGIWYYRVEGVGAVTVAAENQLNVKVSRF